MTNIQYMIQDAIASCRKAGREPVLIVIHPEVFAKLIDELDKQYWFSDAFHKMYKKPNYYGTYQGIDLFVSSKVKDFFIVDDRSWAEQTWWSRKV